jgi:hypothetical protein
LDLNINIKLKKFEQKKVKMKYIYKSNIYLITFENFIKVKDLITTNILKYEKLIVFKYSLINTNLILKLK